MAFLVLGAINKNDSESSRKERAAAWLLTRVAVKGRDASDQKGEQKDGDFGDASLVAGCCRLGAHSGMQRASDDEARERMFLLWLLV